MADSLNPEQQQAVEFTQGPLMIVAGPGTGKTKTLVHRIAYLIQNQSVKPVDILALTFTNKAADEIKQRINGQLVGTFHSLAKNILQQSGQSVDIIEPLARHQLLKKLFSKNFSDIGLLISRSKSGLSVPDGTLNFVDQYNQALSELNLIDFDDLLIKALPLACPGHFQYIFIDEFQDTNLIQYQLIKKILLPHPNICVIGDPYQSIYAFRGADSRIFDQFAADFPDHQKITLKINYRNSPSILKASRQLFPQSDRLLPHSNLPSELQHIQTFDEFSEADFIINFISQKIGGLALLDSVDSVDTTTHFSDFAVIYRTHNLNRVLKQKFLDSGIPFQIVGDDHPFFDQSIITLYSQLKTSAPDSPPLSLIDRLISQLNLPASLLLSEFRNSALRFSSLDQLIQYYDRLIENNFYDPAFDKVTLLTMHATKGLEFKFVFICGFETGLIPHPKADLDEETRLLYVAMTRARCGLYFITAKNRGQKRNLSPSSFLGRIKTKDLVFVSDYSPGRRLSRLKKSQMSLF